MLFPVFKGRHGGGAQRACHSSGGVVKYLLVQFTGTFLLYIEDDIWSLMPLHYSTFTGGGTF